MTTEYYDMLICQLTTLQRGQITMLTTSNLLNHTPTHHRQTNKQSTTPESAPASLSLSIEGRNLEVTFAKTEDSSLFDSLRHTLFQVYIQSLAHPVDREI